MILYAPNYINASNPNQNITLRITKSSKILSMILCLNISTYVTIIKSNYYYYSSTRKILQVRVPQVALTKLKPTFPF